MCWLQQQRAHGAHHARMHARWMRQWDHESHGAPIPHAAAVLTAPLCGGFFGTQPNLKPYGPGPQKHRRAGAHFHYAPIRTYTQLCAPIRTVRTVRTAFGHLVFLPWPSHRKPNQNVCSVKRHWCRCTSMRHQDDIKSVCGLWQHCTWEFLVDERR